MVDTVQTAIYRMKFEGLEQAYQAASAIAKVTVEDEKLDRATRASATAFERTLGKLNPSIQAYQQYQRTLEQVARYEAAGIGTEQQRALLIERATQQYAARTAALSQAAAANDNYNRSAQQTIAIQERINSVTGAGRDFGTVGRASDIASYGQELDRLRAKYNPLFAAGQQYKATLTEINQAARVGAISEAERTAALERTKGAFANQVVAIRRYGTAARGSSGSLAQLSFQINDIASGLLIGQSPFQIMAQQGGQVFQVWQMNNNVFKELKDLIAGLALRVAAFLGPLGLAAVGLGAAGAAAIAFFEITKKEGPKTEDVLKEHARLLGVIKDAYDKATNSASKWVQESRNATLLLSLQEQIDLQRKLNEEVNKQLEKITSTDFTQPLSGFLDFGVKIKEQFEPFSDAIFNLAESFERGQPAVKQFVDEVAAVTLAQPALQALGAELVKNFTAGEESAQKLANALKQVKAIIDVIQGGGAVSPDNRDLLGIGGGRAGQINAYDQLIQRTRDRIEELKAEAEYAGRAAYAVEALKLQHDAERAAKKAGVAVNQQVLDQLKEELVLAQRLRAAANIRASIEFDRRTLGLSEEDLRIVERLKPLYGNDIPAALASTEAAQIRAINRAKEMQDAFQDAAGALVSGLLQGKDVMESLTAAAQSLVQTLANNTLKQFQSRGLAALSGNPAAPGLGSVQGIAGIAASGLAGYQSGSPLTGALGGAMAGFAVGNIPGAIVGGAVGLLGGLFGQSEQEKKAEEARQAQIQAAKDAWKNMEVAWEGFLAAAKGGVIGTVQTGIAQIQSQERQFVDALYAQNPGVETRAMDLTHMAADQAEERLRQEFRETWQGTLHALMAGLGPDSPFMQAFSAVGSAAKQVQDFVANTEFVGTNDPNTAREAGRSYLLSLLETAPALSDTAKAIQELNGKSSALEQALVDLGMSSNEAAMAINAGVTAAMDQLRTSFFESVQSKYYDAAGLGYMNDIQRLADEVSSMRADAAALGADTTLIGRYFTVAAQKIIDGAQVTGTAFDQLASLFPELTGNVHAYTEALDANNTSLDAANQALQASTQTLQSAFDRTKQFVAALREYQKSLLLDSSLSPLSPTNRLAEAATQYRSTQAAALGGDAAAQARLQNATAAYLNEAKSFYASSTGYATIFNEVQSGNQAVIDAAQAEIDLAQQQVDILRSIDSNVISLADALIGYRTATAVQSAASDAQSRATAAKAATALISAGGPTLWGTDILVSQASADQMKAAGVAQSRGGWAGVGSNSTAHADDVRAAIALYRTQAGTGFAAGGVVGNGIWNVDSVRARFAGGGDIMLAGGEFVNPAPSVNAQTLPWLEYIRQTGRPPAVNDNAPLLRELWKELRRGNDALERRLEAMEEAIAGGFRHMGDATRRAAERKPLPGKKIA